MSNYFRALLIGVINAVLIAVGTAGTTLAQAQLDAAAISRLDKSPESAGVLVYRGETFALQSASAEPLFRYERRVSDTTTGLTATHLTRDRRGELIIVESAQVTSTYGLQRFDVANLQSGYNGSVAVAARGGAQGSAQGSAQGQRLDYYLNDGGKISTASEDLIDPVISGPSMHGFILTHWDTLTSGKSIAVRMLVLKEKTTYGFDIRLETQKAGKTSFSVTPSSFLIRLAVAPLRVVFDSNARTVVQYEGRVPPMEFVAGKFKELDARVDYTPVTPNYR